MAQVCALSIGFRFQNTKRGKKSLRQAIEQMGTDCILNKLSKQFRFQITDPPGLII